MSWTSKISDMPAALAVLFVAVGCGVAVLAVTSPRFEAEVELGTSEKPVPSWLGRLLYLVIAAVFLAVGFGRLLVLWR